MEKRFGIVAEKVKSEVDKFNEKMPTWNVEVLEFEKHPEIRIYNEDYSNFIPYKYDPANDEFYKAIERKTYSGELYTIKVVFPSVNLMLEDVASEINGTDMPKTISVDIETNHLQYN